MKNKLFKGISLSANPKHLIKGVFFAAQRVFAESGAKNHTFGNNTLCVAVGNKVIDTRLPQPVGCGDKYDISGLGSGLDLKKKTGDRVKAGEVLYTIYSCNVADFDVVSQLVKVDSGYSIEI